MQCRETSESEFSSTELETRRDMERKTRTGRRRTGYGDLCRYFQKSLTDSFDSDEAQDVIKYFTFIIIFILLCRQQ